MFIIFFYFISIHYHTQKQKRKKNITWDKKINYKKYMDVKKEQGLK